MPDLYEKNGISTIYFDGTYLQNPTGIGRDSRNLLEASQRAFKDSVVVIFPKRRVFSREVKIQSEPCFGKLQKLLKLRSVILGTPYVLKLEPSIALIQSHISDITPIIQFSNKYVIRLHDIFPVTNPEWFKRYSARAFRIGLEEALSKAFFICDSLTTEKELTKLDKLGKVRSSVARCPVLIPSSSKCLNCKGCSVSSKIARHAISISTLEPRKNYSELLQAWRISKAYKVKRCKLLIIGGRGWKSLKLRLRIHITGKFMGITWIRDACDGSVKHLLNNAEFLVSSSKAEGFNLPVAEALVQDVPVLISNNDLNLELYRDNANFYELGNISDFAGKINKMLDEVKEKNYINTKKELSFNYECDLATLQIKLSEIFDKTC